MKRIGIYLHNAPNSGGVYQYMQTIISALAKEKSYCVVGLCVNNEWIRWCKKNKIEYIIVKNKPEDVFWWNLYKLTNFPTKKGIQFINTYFTETGKKIMKAKLNVIICPDQIEVLPFTTPTICVVHDLMHIYERKFPEVGKDYEGREVVFKGIAKGADAVLTDSKLGKKQFQENYIKYGSLPNIHPLPYIPPNHIYHIDNWKLQKENVTLQSLPNKYIFYPAQFWQHKNHINLLKALVIVLKKIPDINLVLVGSNKNGSRHIMQFIQDSHLQNHVTTLGFVKNEEVVYLYKKATALIMPTYFGPTNIPTLEALQLGCPVAVSNIYAMPQQLGRAALYFNPDSAEEIADCIFRLWTNENLRQQLIENGYKKGKQWGEEQFSKRLYKIIERYAK